MSDSGSSRDAFDVAIVGYGPTGLALAHWLGKAGHNTVVIERWPNLYRLPRAGHVDGQIMRLFQRMGVADVIARDSSIMGSTVIRDSTGAELSKIIAEESQQGWRSHYSLYQPNLERTLDGNVRATRNVTILQGWQVESVDASGGGSVRIHIASGDERDGKWTTNGPER